MSYFDHKKIVPPSSWICFVSSDEMQKFKDELKKQYSTLEALNIIKMLFDSKNN